MHHNYFKGTRQINMLCRCSWWCYCPIHYGLFPYIVSQRHKLEHYLGPHLGAQTSDKLIRWWWTAWGNGLTFYPTIRPLGLNLNLFCRACHEEYEKGGLREECQGLHIFLTVWIALSALLLYLSVRSESPVRVLLSMGAYCISFIPRFMVAFESAVYSIGIIWNTVFLFFLWQYFSHLHKEKGLVWWKPSTFISIQAELRSKTMIYSHITVIFNYLFMN